ncbi:TPA: anti-phage protein KwaB [Vibrio parahaemolyticus]|uniref:anti-phage protein KwaB n=1 Tax=Vibrio parahaemolyticus TaxID=670 RepID=UPI001A8F5336|nr:anti-phage protein KwaB [Vibrio parahaemolyticus]EGQ9234612.1 DUF4868 domain-containing protein [Vibrio alginolyticus]EJG1989747.1 DUF4868 domain-containing protein [Vibrio parahaemolyticus]MBO0158088.1 DUF4868 domain-containing protein [Vibrio parahaemolyticus]MBO0173249.1 DUF4868 domain-containing protein [Vibrio parahaemolyticus]MDF4332398.1 DUF4868 domain-containing protein [Vibrio parahaemolyticus]
MSVKFISWFTDFVDSADSISVYFVDDANEIYDSDIDGKVLEKFRENFCKDLRKKYTESDEFEVENLSAFEERKNTLYFYDFSPREMPFEFSLTQKALKIKANDNVPKYKTKEQKLSNIKGAVIILTQGTQKSVAFYQHVFPVSLLGPDKGVLNITTHDTRLVELEQDVLKLNTKFVFLEVKGKYFVENVGVLESNLHFKKAINSRAKKYANEIASMNLVDDVTLIRDRIDKEPSYAKKLITAYKNSVVLKLGISNQEMIAYAQSQDYYKDHLKPNATGDSFVIDKVTQSKRFIELLNDNFLKSELTEEHYLARSKKHVG